MEVPARAEMPPRAGATPWLVAAVAIVAGLTLLQFVFIARGGLNLDFEEEQPRDNH